MSQMLQIHDQLREMILSLDIAPGERLTERWLEARFQGSAHPGAGGADAAGGRRAWSSATAATGWWRRST